MWTIFKTKITKVVGDEKVDVEDSIIREVQLTIVVNGKKIGALMAVRVELKELCAGYLISENIIKDVCDIKKIEIEDESGEEKNFRAIVDADTVKDSLDKLDLQGVIVSGCGRALSAHVSPKAIEAGYINSEYRIDADLLFAEMSKFYAQCPLYEQTGCVHTAKLYIDDSHYFIGEDIAQHNTIDKAVGKARLAGADVKKSFLMVSGRLSSEMVAKAVMHQVPILASRTASTCRGINIADRFGLTLIGFVRGEKMNIYRNPQRINI